MEKNLDKLAELFKKFPGIGSRQAKRFAYFILSQPQSYVGTLTEALTTARANSRICEECLRVFEGSTALCNICADQGRDGSQLIIVEKGPDIEAFATTDYRGKFFVLGGLIPIVQKDVLAGTNIKILVDRMKTATPQTEIILAFPVTPNGEHTDQVVREMLARYPLEISSLGRGLSTGTELEYADPASLAASLKKRE